MTERARKRETRGVVIMKTKRMRKIVLAASVILLMCGSALAATGEVISYQKISDTEGGFTGTLDNDDHFGSVASLGDLDGDGITDIAVGANGDDDGGTNRGAVWILFLNADGTVKNYQKISDTEGGFTGTLDNDDIFGVSICTIGDLNEDGVTDIVVSALYDSDGGYRRGAVWIIFLETNGMVKAHQKISDTEGNFSGTLDDQDQFGNSVICLDDLDGDGTNDIAVSAYTDDDGGSDRGAIWILFLNSDGTVKDHQKISNTQGGFTGELSNGDLFGSGIAYLGDLDGDGITDLAASARRDDDGGTDRGAVWILFLNSDGTVKSHQKISDIEGSFTGVLDNDDELSNDLELLGDLDGDGNVDLAAGVRLDDDGGTSRGAVWILFLNSDGTVKAHQKISDTEGNFDGILNNDDWFGGKVTLLGDLNGDGAIEISVGARQDDDGGTNRGAVWILFLEGPIIYHVDGVSGDNNNNGLSRETAFATIQKGVDVANDLDTVLVWPGVYLESIYFIDKAITVKAAGDAPILEAGGSNAVSFYTSEGQETVLSNFVIRDSDTGIFVSTGTPTIRNITLAGNDLGIEAENGAMPDIRNCIFWNNMNGDLWNCTAQYSFVGDEEADPNLIGYWKLDGDAVDSAGSNDGTIYGAVPTTGKINEALDFDGVDDYVDLGNDSSLKPNLPVTFCTWIKLRSLGTVDAIITTDDIASKYYGITFAKHTSNKIYIIYGDGTGRSSTDRRTKVGTTALNTGTWYHVAAIVKGPTDMELYVNGENDGGIYSGTGGDVAHSASSAYVGSSGHSSDWFDGAIDEVRIFDRALTAEEIEGMYKVGLAGGEYGSPLFADANSGDYHLLSERGRYRATTDEWILDDASSPCIDGGEPNVVPSEEAMPNGGRINMGAYGGTASASMSEWGLEADFDYDGIVANGDVGILSDDWLEELTFSEETTGSALQFDGVDDYVEVPYTEDFQVSVLTLMGWVYPTTDLSTNGGTIVTRGEDAITDRSHFGLGVRQADSPWGQGVGVGYETDNDDDYAYSSGWYPPVEEWTHLAASRAIDGLLTIYANGEVIGQWQATPTPTSMCQQDLTIGASKDNPSGTVSFFPGLIDEVTIYNRALTDEEIEDIYHCGVVADANLVGYWDFEEGEGQTAGDSSGNGNDGQLGSDPDSDSADPVWVESEVPGAVWHVDGASGDNSNDGLSRETAFATIQKGVSSAEDCDTVVVWPGVYDGPVYIVDKAIVVKSADEPAVIDGGFDDAVALYSWEGKKAVLKNFVIKNGFAGVYVYNGRPELANLTIVDCYTGVEAETGAEPNIVSSILWDNDYDLWNCAAQYSFVGGDFDANLVSYWKLDGDAVDSAGSNDGTIYGAVPATGQIGGALSFDGSDDYANCGNDESLNIERITISAWINSNVLSGSGNRNKVILMKFQDSLATNESAFGFSQSKGDYSKLGFGFNDGSWHSWLTANSVMEAGWMHVAVTYDGVSEPVFYVNGLIETTDGTGVPAPLPTNTTDLTIGAQDATDPSAYFDGIIDDVRIYDRALSAEEIEAMYEAGLAGGELGPLFADANSGDYHLLSERGRYRATTDEWILDDVTSRCIDGGDPNASLGGEVWPNGGRINMGAYGGTTEASRSEWPFAGDLNLDGIVNLADFALLAEDWLEALPWAE